MKFVAAFAFAGFLLSTASVEAASFNCRYAKSPVEVAICQDDYLRSLDQRMSRTYFDLLSFASRPDQRYLKRTQARFINRRNRCGYSDTCIGREYELRIGELCEVAGDYGDRC